MPAFVFGAAGIQLREYNMPMDITLTELEDAINYWRSMRPAQGEERALSPEVDALATAYALMIYHRAKTMPLEALDQVARQLLDAWRRKAA